MRKVISLLGVTLLGLTIGCSNNESEQANSNIKEEVEVQKNIKTVEFSAELDKNYKTLKELKKDAEIMAQVEVISTETIVYENLPFTFSEVKVLKSKKGKVKKNETLKIIETGGVYSPKGKDGEEELQQVDYKLNGVSVLKEGDKQYLLLKKFEGPQVDKTDTVYIPVGAYQGKFKINGNKVYQQAKMETDESTFEEFVDTSLDTFESNLDDSNL